MRVQVTGLQQWKGEYTAQTSEDAKAMAPESGTFAVADGVATAAYPQIWANILVNHFVYAPLSSTDPFEVEWWLRQPQAEFRKQVPEPSTIKNPQAREKAKEGSNATLVGIRTLKAEKDSAELEIVALGDACAFHAQSDPPADPEGLFSFPLTQPRQFDEHPICMPSQDFRRSFQQVRRQVRTVVPGDIVVLATDAVSRWIVDRARESEPSRWDALQRLVATDESNFQQFILDERAAKRLHDDDSTMIVLRFLDDAAATGDLVQETPPPQPDDLRQQKFQEALKSGDEAELAVLAGDLAVSHVKAQRSQVEQWRKVANARDEVVVALRRHMNGDKTQIQTVWERHRGLLEQAVCADGLRKSLVALGVLNSDLSLARIPPPASSTSTHASIRSPEVNPTDPRRIRHDDLGPGEWTRDGARREREDRQRAFVEATDEQREALQKALLGDGDDTAIVDAIANYPSSDPYFRRYETRIREAKRRVSALATLRRLIREEEQQNHVTIRADVTIQGLGPDLRPESLTNGEKARISDAIRRLTSLEKLERAVANNRPRELQAAWEPLLEGYDGLQSTIRDRVHEVTELCSLVDQIRKSAKSQHGEVIAGVVERIRALDDDDDRLKDLESILADEDPTAWAWLDAERDRLRAARKLDAAFQARNALEAARILAERGADAPRILELLQTGTTLDRQMWIRQFHALAEIREAISGVARRQLRAKYRNLLQDCPFLTEQAAADLQRAVREVEMIEHLRLAIKPVTGESKYEYDARIAEAYRAYQDVGGATRPDDLPWSLIDGAARRVEYRQRVAAGFRIPGWKGIVSTAKELEICFPELSVEQRQRTTEAFEDQALYWAIRRANHDRDEAARAQAIGQLRKLSEDRRRGILTELPEGVRQIVEEDWLPKSRRLWGSG